MSIRRRGIIQSFSLPALWACGPVLACLGFAGASALRADEFDLLRLKWRDFLTGGTNLDLGDSLVQSRLTSIANTANNYWASLDTSPGRNYLWSDAARTNQSEDISACYSRLRAMALAWATRGCALEGNPALANDIVSGLDWMYAHRYNEARSEYDNWWDWEIGSPQNLNNALVLMFDALTGTQLTNYFKAVDKFVPAATYTGANRTDTALVVAIRGILGRNAAKLANARDGLSPVFPYVTSGDGFYTDGSFIQHTRHPYTGSYGSVLISGISSLMLLLHGSTWAVTDPNRANVFRWVYDSYEPVIFKGATMDNLRGRAISRRGSQDHNAGAGNISSILQIAQTAPPVDAAAFKRMVKYWIQADTYLNFTNNVSLSLLPMTQQLMADTNVVPRGELMGHYQFPCMDRVVHLRPGFGFAISMSSSRIYTYESINSENLHGWFTGDGMTWLYNGDLGQFSGNFWPTIDPYHLPGTTVDTTPRANGSGQSATTGQRWVGGVSLSSGFGAAGMSLDAQASTLAAQKSWFMFDNEIVCLGAGISCSSTNPVHTTVENRRLSASATNAFAVDGAAMPLATGWLSNLNAISWCALAGAGGYYFPGGATLLAAREARTNSWYDINQNSLPTGSITNKLTENFLRLWFNHGRQPSNATYAYVLLPNLATNAVAAYAANPDILALANSTSVQAVKETTLGVVAAHFWVDGTNSADLITANKKCAVITRETTNGLEVAVSDPTQTNTGAILVTLNRSANWTLSADAGVTVLQLSPQIQFSVGVNGVRGRSLRVAFSFSAQAPNPTWDAVPAVPGAQDGAGTWSATAANWWDGVTNSAWDNARAPIAILGNGGVPGTIDLPAPVTAAALTFYPVSPGNYTLAGNGPLTMYTGLTANASATFSVPLTLASNQLWTIATGQRLMPTTVAAAQPLALSLAGGGTLALSSANDTLPAIVSPLNFAGNATLEIGSTRQTLSALALLDGAMATVVGTGTLRLPAAAGLAVGGTVAGATQTLSLSNLNAFFFDAGANSLNVGGAVSAPAANTYGYMHLADSNFLRVAQLAVPSGTGGGSTWNYGYLYLGVTNVIYTDALSLGAAYKSYGYAQFRAGLANPRLVLRAADGGGSATVNIGTGSTGGYSDLGSLDLTTGVTGSSWLDARVGTLRIGYNASSSSGVFSTGTLRMAAGVLDTTNIILGATGAGSPSSVKATLSVNGGTITVQSFTLGDIQGTGTTSTNTFTLDGGGTLLVQNLQPGAGSAARLCNWNSGTIRNFDAATDLNIAAGLTLTLASNSTHTFHIDANRTGTIRAVLAGAGDLTKTGAGSLLLTAANSYLGGTTISAGTLALSGAGAISLSPALTVGPGAVFDATSVSGGYVLGAAQTLGGTGTVRGNVTLAGTLSPGVSLGALTFSNDLLLAAGSVTVIELNASNGSCDKVVGLQTLTYGGTLLVTNLAGTLAAGQSYLLFSAAHYSGNFAATNLPALGPGRHWSWNPDGGWLAVAPDLPPYPTNLTVARSGGGLELSWPATHLGWLLQSNSHNLTSSSQWFEVPGSSTVTNLSIPIPTAIPTVFYRLCHP